MARAKKETKKVEEQAKQFLVTTRGNDIHVTNESLSDIEMLGVLTLLVDAYKERFKGGAANAEENTKPGGKA